MVFLFGFSKLPLLSLDVYRFKSREGLRRDTARKLRVSLYAVVRVFLAPGRGPDHPTKGDRNGPCGPGSVPHCLGENVDVSQNRR